MRRIPVFRVKEVDPAAERALLILDLYTYPLTRVNVTEALFELPLDIVRHVTLPVTEAANSSLRQLVSCSANH